MKYSDCCYCSRTTFGGAYIRQFIHGWWHSLFIHVCRRCYDVLTTSEHEWIDIGDPS